MMWDIWFENHSFAAIQIVATKIMIDKNIKTTSIIFNVINLCLEKYISSTAIL